MADLSHDDRKIIENHPFYNTLDHLRDTLRKAEHAAAGNSDPGAQEAVSSLLLALMGQRSAYNLRSKTSNLDVASELATLFKRIRNRDFDYQYYRSLARLVIDKAPDTDIWSAVLNLITTISRTSPPASIAPSFDGTPITRSSASFQGNEQTKKLLNDALFWEIRECTHRGVKGFWEKYFEGKEWSQRGKEIYDAVQGRYADGRWTDFPDPPIEGSVWDWLSRFQDEGLTDARNVFYRTQKTSDFTGTEPLRQLDIFFKHRNRPTDGKHNWKDVLIVGEHKQSDDRVIDYLVQLGGYVREVFAVQPTRRFVHGFILSGTKMELWVFDRSGPYSSGKFDIHAEPESFVRALAGYAMMSDDELGLDAFLQQEDGGPFVAVTEDASGATQRFGLEPEPFVRQRAVICRGTTCFRTRDGANVVKFSWTSDKRKPEAEHLRLAREKGVRGIANLLGYQRITSIQDLRKGLTFTAPYTFQLASPRSSVLSSQSTLLSQSRQAPGIDEVLGKRGSDEHASAQPGKKPRSSSQKSKLGQECEAHPADEAAPGGKRKSDESATAEPRKKSRSSSQQPRPSQEHEAPRPHDDAAAMPPPPSRPHSRRSKPSPDQEHNALQPIEERGSLHASKDGPFANRLFSCLVIAPAGRALRGFESILELLTVLCDAIKAHRSLLCDGGILHRDISENNIIITDPEQTDGFTGMLIDLDLAKLLHSSRSGAWHKTGTMEFMAIQVLQGADHTYRHDLESFFYVLLWMCARRAWDKRSLCDSSHRPRESRLKKWYVGRYDDIAESKEHHMSVNGFKGLLLEFPQALDYIKPTCTQIRTILFPILKDGSMDIGTSSGPPEELYDAIIGAFDDAIATAEGEGK